MPEFEEFQEPSWMTRTSACRYFGLPDDDDGWDRLNEIIQEFEIDCELGETGDVLRVDANDLNVTQALFTKHKREVGHAPDEPSVIAAERERVMMAATTQRDRRQDERRAKLGKRIAARKKSKKSRLEE